MIDGKWDSFEKRTRGVDSSACAFMTEQHFDALMRDRSIVLGIEADIRAVQTNARLLLNLGAEHGRATRFFADWPDSDYVGLLDVLKRRARCGTSTGCPRIVRVC